MADITVTFGKWKDIQKTPLWPLVFVSGDTEKEFTIEAKGTIKRTVLKMPAFSGAAVTGALSITDSDDTVIYNKDGMAEDDDHVRLVDEPVVGDNTVKVTLSADPLSGGTCYVGLYLEGT